MNAAPACVLKLLQARTLLALFMSTEDEPYAAASYLHIIFVTLSPGTCRSTRFVALACSALRPLASALQSLVRVCVTRVVSFRYFGISFRWGTRIHRYAIDSLSKPPCAITVILAFLTVALLTS